MANKSTKELKAALTLITAARNTDVVVKRLVESLNNVNAVLDKVARRMDRAAATMAEFVEEDDAAE